MLHKKKPSQHIDLSIVIPALREERRIGKTLDELAKFVTTEPLVKTLTVEVIVVAASGGDKTVQVVLEKQKKFASLSILKPGPVVGKGRDVKVGMLRAKGAAVLFMDADLATPLKYIPKFYRAFSSGIPVIIATRNLRRHHPGYIRRLLSNVGNLLFRLTGGVWVEDSQCGFKMFSHEAAQLCFTKLEILGWGFDMEILAIAHTNKLRIKSYRINDWVSVPEGSFAEGIFKNSLVTLKELVHILWSRVNRRYVEKSKPHHKLSNKY